MASLSEADLDNEIQSLEGMAERPPDLERRLRGLVHEKRRRALPPRVIHVLKMTQRQMDAIRAEAIEEQIPVGHLLGRIIDLYLVRRERDEQILNRIVHLENRVSKVELQTTGIPVA